MQQTKLITRSLPLPVKVVIVLSVILLFVGWLLNTPEGLLGKADAIGYGVCHRLDARSFHLGDRQVPLCVRCTGMYLGAVLGMGYLGLVGGKRGGMPVRRLWIVFGLFVVAFGVDGLNSYMHLFPGFPSLYEPQHWLRMLTGTGMGLVVAALILPAFHQTVWERWDGRPALDGFRALLPLLGVALFLDWVTLTENPLFLYPLAVITAAGVLILLTLVYTVLWVMMLRLDNRFQNFRQLAFFLALGFGAALLQIVALDVVRYLLTGTWAGFQLG